MLRIRPTNLSRKNEGFNLRHSSRFCVTQSTSQPPSQWPARPLWLLPEPRRATEVLQLVTHPERIENGWWGKDDVRRDYCIAHNEKGSYYWVFRSRLEPSSLFIHGIFA